MPLFGTDIDSWNIYMPTSLYVQLPGAARATDLEARFPDLVEEVINKSASRFPFQLKLQPITDIHLNPDISGPESVGNPIHAYILSGIALGGPANCVYQFYEPVHCGFFHTRKRNWHAKGGWGITRTTRSTVLV